MIEHGTFVRATVAEGQVVDGIVLNSLMLGGEQHYIVGWEPQVAGQRVLDWARRDFVSEANLAPLASLIPAAESAPAAAPAKRSK